MSTKQEGFSKEFLAEARKKGSFKPLAGVVGMPDKEDWENIVSMISLYRRKSVEKYGYDILVDCIATARKQYKSEGRDYSKGKFNIVNKDSAMRYHFELPESFVHMIEKAYPLMFVDREHYHWFCRNFAELRISDSF